MGIKMLGKFIKLNCSESITITHMESYRGCTVIIDISIYLYKYKIQKSLLTNIYLMCSVFKHYNITPIFVFDGRAGIEKTDELKKRREEKRSAKYEYYKIIESNDIINDTMKNYLVQLEKKFMRITRDDIVNVKSLLDNYGVSYYQAEKEADELCAYLIHNGYGDVIISDDMDLFAYGCPRIIRHLDIVNHTCLSYDIKSILLKLNMSMNNFKWLCIFAGTDYYDNDKNIFYYYNKYKKLKINENFKEILFELNKDDIDKLNNIFNIFNLSKNKIQFSIKENKTCNKKGLYNLLEKENFIFVK